MHWYYQHNLPCNSTLLPFPTNRGMYCYANMLSLQVGCYRTLHFHDEAPEFHVSRTPEDRFQSETSQHGNIYVDNWVNCALTIYTYCINLRYIRTPLSVWYTFKPPVQAILDKICEFRKKRLKTILWRTRHIEFWSLIVKMDISIPTNLKT